MPMNVRTTTHHRLGNALILVVGILVLLVLIATAFITKTQSGRITAVSQRDAARIDDRARGIARTIADEVAVALFPRKLVPNNGVPSNSANDRRVRPELTSQRYGHDADYPFNFAPYEVVPWTNPPDNLMNGIPLLGPANPVGGPSFGDSRWLRDTEPYRGDLYNFVQQGVDQWANFSWVDGTPETFTHWGHLTNLSRSENGWRIPFNISDITNSGLVTNLDIPIEQWPAHRPTNQNGTLALGPTGYPSMGYTEDLGDAFDTSELDSPNSIQHQARWNQWFTLGGWATANFQNPNNTANALPQNFLNLSDLDADGIENEIGERAFDAFIKGTPRWYAELHQADTDGDGFTDALWHLHPQSLGLDTWQLVAVSVTDNSALLNANVATGFSRVDLDLDNDDDFEEVSTRGNTPADLALIGSNVGGYNWRVGFLDNPANLPDNGLFTNKWVDYTQIGLSGGQIGPYGTVVKVDWNGSQQWNNWNDASFLDELGIEVDGNNSNPLFQGYLNPTDDITSKYGRLWYWQLAGRQPFLATNGLRPFTLSDELELRVTYGNNYQFVGSRFERSLNRINDPNYQFLRSDYIHSHEASELRDQLDNRQLLFDNRRKLTLFNGVRNDLLPPWLRWEDRFWNRYNPEGFENGEGEPYLPSGPAAFDLTNPEWEYVPEDVRSWVFASAFPLKLGWEGAYAGLNNNDLTSQDTAIANWLEQSRQKVDLREYYADTTFGIPPNGTVWWDSLEDGRLPFADRLPLQLLLAMTDAQESGVGALDTNGAAANAPLGSYSEPSPFTSWSQLRSNPYQQARLMAAGMAANVLAYRDNDDTWRQHSPLPTVPDVANLPTGDAYGESEIPLSGAIAPPIIGRQANADPSIPTPTSFVAGPNQPSVEMLGLEAQPFILEAFVAHVHQTTEPSEISACCLQTGGCEDVSKETCEGMLGGTFYIGEECDPNGDGDFEDGPCPDQGACCVPLGGCLFTSQGACDSLEGEFFAGELCEESTCEGACCFDNAECGDISGYSCDQLGGVFAGFESECADLPCSPSGSCCFASDSCMDVISIATCNEIEGTYNANEFCVSKPCEPSACCLSAEYGDCFEVSEKTCNEVLGGTYKDGQSCSADPCVPSGSCCFGSGSCVDVVSSASCISDGGTYFPGILCLDDANDTTVIVSSTQDTWISEENPNVPFGGGTYLRLAEQFVTSSWKHDYILLDFVINPNSVDGSRITEALLSLEWEASGGEPSTVEVARMKEPWLMDRATWNSTGYEDWPGGSGALFDIDNGLPSYSFEIGDGESVEVDISVLVQDAIANRDGLVSLLIFKETADGEFSYSQFESSSTILGVPPTLSITWLVGDTPCVGSCCFATGLCEELSEETCNNRNGTYKQFFTCEESPCQGACCLPAGGCVDISAQTCNDRGGVYRGASTQCLQQLCDTTGACCLSSFSCVEVLDQDSCEEELGGRFYLNADCEAQTCFELGACCFGLSNNAGGADDANCELISSGTCDNVGGLFLGEGVGCASESCAPTGACCFSDDTTPQNSWCINVLQESECTTLGGLFIDDNFCSGGASVCTTGIRFACCLDTGLCTNVPNQLVCETTLGGTYIGDGVRCDSDPCTPTGECCLPSHSCLDIREDICVGLAGVWDDADNCNSDSCAIDTIACCILGGVFDDNPDTQDKACVDISESSCASLDGISFGKGSDCSSDPCSSTGSCCLDSGSCIEVLDESSCDSLGGLFVFGQGCNEQPCAGSCCHDDGACTNVAKINAADCIDVGGVFRPGESCNAQPCIGACCIEVNDTCVEVSEYSCINTFGGIFQTHGTDCSINLCVTDLEGACCVGGGDNTCVEVTLETCQFVLRGEYQGDGSLCADQDPDSACLSTGPLQQACCLGDICVEVVDDNHCRNLGGVYLGDAGCDVHTCEGACCLGSCNACKDTTPSLCIELGGTFVYDTSCSDNTIPPVCGFGTGTTNGACCVDELCIDVDDGFCCEDIGGEYLGAGTSCAFDSCLGACCLESGTCIEATDENCIINLDGTFMGNGVSCGTTPCRGGCCFDSGTCLDVKESTSCLILNGDFMGYGSVCSTNPCEGACCLEQVGCVDVSPFSCSDVNGIFMGRGSVCGTEPCIDGACCLPTGTCLESRSGTCNALGGTFFDSISCETRPCLGACCLWAGGCEDLSIDSCYGLWDPDGDGQWSEEDAPGYFHGFGQQVGYLCDSEPCVPPDGSCCLPSNSCVDIQDLPNQETDPDGFVYFCETVLEGTYRPGNLCDENPCGGACCLSTGGCENLPEQTCDAIDGVFMGAGVFCDSNPCGLPGACCYDSGSCLFVSEIVCLNMFGEFQGPALGNEDPCNPDDDLDTNDGPCVPYFIVSGDVESSPQETVAVVQLANPFDREIDLNNFAVELFGQEIRLADLESIAGVGYERFMAPTTVENPATLILYAIAKDTNAPPNPGNVDPHLVTSVVDPLVIPRRHFAEEWLDFLDLNPKDHPDETIFVYLPNNPDYLPNEPHDEMYCRTNRTDYDNLLLEDDDSGDPIGDNDDITTRLTNSIALYRFDKDPSGIFRDQRVLIDRLDAEPGSEDSFTRRMVELYNDPDGTDLLNGWELVEPEGYITLTDESGSRIPAVPFTSMLYLQWNRATRAWGVDTPLVDGWHNDTIDSWERNPRYVFAARDFTRGKNRYKVTNAANSQTFSEIQYSSSFYWTDYDDPDDRNGDGVGEDDVNKDTNADDDLLPDKPDPWFTVEVWSPRAGDLRPDETAQGRVQGGLRFRKPTYFDFNNTEDPKYDSSSGTDMWSYPDKGWYGQRVDHDNDGSTSDTPAFEDMQGPHDTDPDGIINEGEIDLSLSFPMQMLQKDNDFDQVGELLNVWLLGHMVEGTPLPSSSSPSTYVDIQLVLPPTPFDIDDSSGQTETRVDAGTITTFSEFMYPGPNDWYASWVGAVDNSGTESVISLDERVNRLRFLPAADGLPLMMGGRSDYDALTQQAVALNHAWPRQSIAARVLDSFVCDGPGRPDTNGDGIGDDLNPYSTAGEYWPTTHSFFNANGFTGRSTPGIININTAPVEVMRALPHMTKVVHATAPSEGGMFDPLDRNPRTLIPEAMVHWRDGATGFPDGISGGGFTGGPNYSNRSTNLGLTFGLGPKQTRGFSSPGEIGMLRLSGGSGIGIDNVIEPWHSGTDHQAIMDRDAWRIDFAAMEPFLDPSGTGDLIFIDENVDGDFEYADGDRSAGAPISTDVNNSDYYYADSTNDEQQISRIIGDRVSGDAEEINLLQAGISNLVSTSSDMFTVYMRIRTFKRNSITGVWDATDLDQIIDDSRYVMLVDRSNVNKATDKPKILFLEKIPN